MKDWQEKLQEAKDLLEIGIISEADYQELKADFLGKSEVKEIPVAPSTKPDDISQPNMILIPAGTFWMGVETKEEAYYA